MIAFIRRLFGYEKRALTHRIGWGGVYVPKGGKVLAEHGPDMISEWEPSPTPRAAGQTLAAIAAKKKRAARSAAIRRHIAELKADIARAHAAAEQEKDLQNG